MLRGKVRSTGPPRTHSAKVTTCWPDENQPGPPWAKLSEHFRHILLLYRQYEDNRPVILLDIQEERIDA